MVVRLGLQKRIMLYVAVGLVLMFGVVFYFGTQDVQRSTDLVFEERLAVAEGVAAALATDFAHVIRDVPEHITRDVPEHATKDVPGNHEAILEAVQKVFYYLANVDVFAFFKVTSLWLVDTDGYFLAAVPAESMEESREVLPTLLAKGALADSRPHVLWLGTRQPESFVAISVPLKDAEGKIWVWVMVNTEGFNASHSFVPFGLVSLVSNDWQVPTLFSSARAEYHLEVLAPNGNVALGIGPDENVGRLSPHFSPLGHVIGAKESGVMLHRVTDGGQANNHVMAAAPVPLSDLYMVLEQSEDVALALPSELRRKLLVFSTLGFLLTLTVAWVTTRHVVKPTELLTAAAVRMARGELSTPIRVRAQDEIGVLASNLETMRQQLQDALNRVESAKRELESKVQERTYQLRELVRRVITAQEEERRRIALGLHDETAQALTAISVMLDSLLRGKNTPGGDALLREARQTADSMMEGLRRLIRALRPVALQEMRLVAALRSYAEDYLEKSGVTIHATEEGTEAKAPDEIELALYHIGQEALNNVAKHAKARNVWITLAYDSSFVRLTVLDDGVGFCRERVADSSGRTRGLGLAGIRERASLVGGKLVIETAPGKGTLVQVEVPIPTDG